MNTERMRGIFANLLLELEEAKIIDNKANSDIMTSLNDGIEDTKIRNFTNK